MKLKLQKRQSDPNDMRLQDMENDKTLGHIIRYYQYGNWWFRATVQPKDGFVYGRDCSSIEDACHFLLEKNENVSTYEKTVRLKQQQQEIK